MSVAQHELTGGGVVLGAGMIDMQFRNGAPNPAGADLVDLLHPHPAIVPVFPSVDDLVNFGRCRPEYAQTVHPDRDVLPISQSDLDRDRPVCLGRSRREGDNRPAIALVPTPALPVKENAEKAGRQGKSSDRVANRNVHPAPVSCAPREQSTLMSQPEEHPMSASIHSFSAWGTGVAALELPSSSPDSSGAANAGEGAHLIAPSPATIILLKALATHDGVSLAHLVERLACERARALGLSRLARAVADRNLEAGASP